MRLDEAVQWRLVRTGLDEHREAGAAQQQLVHLHAQGRPEKQTEWLNSFFTVLSMQELQHVPPCPNLLAAVFEIVHLYTTTTKNRTPLHGARVVVQHA